METPKFTADLLFPTGKDEVAQVLDRYGIRAGIRVAQPVPDPNEFLLKAVASMVIIGPASAFLAAIASEAGKDAYRRLKSFLQDLRKARPDQLVMLDDRDERMVLVLNADLPDEALRALFELDLHEFSGRGTTGWDPEAHQWTPGVAFRTAH